MRDDCHKEAQISGNLSCFFWLNFTQTFGHVHEIYKRLGSHLLHDLSAVLLDGDFAVVELDRDLFVEQINFSEPDMVLVFSACRKRRGKLAWLRSRH